MSARKARRLARSSPVPSRVEADRPQPSSEPAAVTAGSATGPVSAREARRAAAAAMAPGPLVSTVDHVMATYRPTGIAPGIWEKIRPVVAAVLAHSPTRGAESLRKQVTHLVRFVAWAVTDAGISPRVDAVMTHELIEAYASSAETARLSPSTRSTRRSVLRRLASAANPGPDAPPQPPPVRRRTLQDPYSPDECARIERIVRHQRTRRLQGQAMAAVALGLGAGLGPSDLRHLRRRHIDDRGPDGIWIRIPEPRARTVVCHIRWEPLLRDALELLGRTTDGRPRRGDSWLIIGTKANRHNITGHLYDAVVHHDPNLELDQARMRTTWLLTQLQTPGVTLPTLMAAAGLTTTRTLTELVAHITPGQPQVLRGQPRPDPPDDHDRGGGR